MSVYHSPDATFGRSSPSISCWWFMHRELDKPEQMRETVGGTYAMDCSGIPRELVGGLGWLPVVGAVVNDFGDLVPVPRIDQ